MTNQSNTSRGRLTEAHTPQWEEMAKAGLELAQYASYAEIVGAISHNRQAIRKWCDKVFEFHHANEKAEWDRLTAEYEAEAAGRAALQEQTP